VEIKPWDRLLNVLPPLTSYEFEALKASIAEHGVLQHILVMPDGRIIDGCHRWRIAQDKVRDGKLYDILNLDDDTAFLLGLAVNTARRQMSFEQIKELRKKQRKIALELRKNERMSQEKVAGILGVPAGTIAWWEAEAKKDISILGAKNTYNPPDLRIKISREDYKNIYEQIRSGKSQVQVAADHKITQARISQIVQSVEKRAESSQRRRELAEVGGQLVTPEGTKVETGDFRELAKDIPSNSIDLVFTDPSYGEDYLDLWSPLAQLAARVLKPGRFLLTYCGKLYLPTILAKLGEHLQYYWIAGKYYDQGHSFFRSKKIWDQWRPILIYQKPGPTEHEWFLDMIRMGNRKDAKELHDYGQSMEDAGYYIQKLTVPGEVVLDVCCGSGTILVAAKRCNRKAIGFDIDESRTRIAKGRLAEVVNETPKVS
jgi:site-specific DNA-methyltransferase (adenine-specific)